MRILFNSQITAPINELVFDAKEMFPDGVSSTSTVREEMTPFENGPGLYEIDAPFPVGDYYVHISSLEYETVLLLRVFDDQSYNLVPTPDDFGRELTGPEIEEQLQDDFDAPPTHEVS